MKKLLALLLLSPLVFADSREKVINLVCNPTTTLICINDGDCQTFTEQDMRLNKIGDTEIKNISVKQLKTETFTVYFMDRGLGFELAEENGNKITIVSDGDELNEAKQFAGLNLIYEFNLLNKEFVYSTTEKKYPYNKIFASNFACTEATSLFD